MSPQPQQLQRARLEMVRTATAVEYTITGARSDVLAEIETLFIEYEPAEYGTEVRAMRGSKKDQTYHARVTRRIAK